MSEVLFGRLQEKLETKILSDVSHKNLDYVVIFQKCYENYGYSYISITAFQTHTMLVRVQSGTM